LGGGQRAHRQDGQRGAEINRGKPGTGHVLAKGLLPESAARESFILMDSTHVMSASEYLKVNAKGYNGSFDFGKQVRLMYFFSAKMKLPVYYRLLGGNIVDVAEMGVFDVVYIADKGFYSKGTMALLEERNLWYIMPVRRSNPAIDYGPVGDGDFKLKHRRFTWQGRVICYYHTRFQGLPLSPILMTGFGWKKNRIT
jgi:hypothetical protein